MKKWYEIYPSGFCLFAISAIDDDAKRHAYYFLKKEKIDKKDVKILVAGEMLLIRKR